MKKNFTRLLLTAAIIVAPLTSKAQWNVGVQGGYTYNTLTTSSGYMYDRNFKGEGGFTASVTGGYQLTNWFALQADLGVAQKSYKIFRTIPGAEREHMTYKNTYIQLPVYTQFSFGGKKLRGFANIGGYIGHWTAGKNSGVTPSLNFNKPEDGYQYVNHNYEFNSTRDNRIEAGLMGGMGLSYLISDKLKLFAEGRYYYSLTDMQKKYMLNQMPRYNNTIALQIGCTFNFIK